MVHTAFFENHPKSQRCTFACNAQMKIRLHVFWKCIRRCSAAGKKWMLIVNTIFKSEWMSRCRSNNIGPTDKTIGGMAARPVWGMLQFSLFTNWLAALCIGTQNCSQTRAYVAYKISCSFSHVHFTHTCVQAGCISRRWVCTKCIALPFVAAGGEVVMVLVPLYFFSSFW